MPTKAPRFMTPAEAIAEATAGSGRLVNVTVKGNLCATGLRNPDFRGATFEGSVTLSRIGTTEDLHFSACRVQGNLRLEYVNVGVDLVQKGAEKVGINTVRPLYIRAGGNLILTDTRVHGTAELIGIHAPDHDILLDNMRITGQLHICHIISSTWGQLELGTIEDRLPRRLLLRRSRFADVVLDSVCADEEISLEETHLFDLCLAYTQAKRINLRDAHVKKIHIRTSPYLAKWDLTTASGPTEITASDEIYQPAGWAKFFEKLRPDVPVTIGQGPSPADNYWDEP